MSRPVVIRVGELLPAERAAERALARDRRDARRIHLQAHAREVFETIRAVHSAEDAEVWCSAMRELLRPSAVVGLAPARVPAAAAGDALFRFEGDAPSAGGEP